MGQGYVGLPLAMRAVEVGHRVFGFEPDPRRLAMLGAGESYVEDVSSEDLSRALASGRYHAGAHEGLDRFDVAVIAVPTPLRDRAPDLSAVEAASRALAPHLTPGAIVVLESTTYPGTTEEVVGPILEGGSGLRAGIEFHLGYSSERIDPGNRTWRLVNTPKLVSGVNEQSLAAIRGFYEEIVDAVVPVSHPGVAELAKLLENTFRHVNIALVNELAVFAHELGIDVWEAIDAASTKPFGFMRFEPGPGVGGHCLPVDPSYLSWRVRQDLGRDFRFVELANDINDHMPEHVVRRVTELLNRNCRAVNGSRILLLGLAYKRNSGDCRESPALAIAGRLVALGADVRAADPHVVESLALPGVTRVDPSPSEIGAADVVVVLTDHDAFDLEAVARDARLVFDTRHHVPGKAVEHL
ncbi:MAG: nucleotide sugar dehydrogenase [Acidimicrobiales bacterium]